MQRVSHNVELGICMERQRKSREPRIEVKLLSANLDCGRDRKTFRDLDGSRQ